MCNSSKTILYKFYLKYSREYANGCSSADAEVYLAAVGSLVVTVSSVRLDGLQYVKCRLTISQNINGTPDRFGIILTIQVRATDCEKVK